MIVGYHIILGTYGFWLPIDPRGSWSDFVGSRELFPYGPATKTTEMRSALPRPRQQRFAPRRGYYNRSSSRLRKHSQPGQTVEPACKLLKPLSVLQSGGLL
jgi:hypothetical protein